MKRLNIHQSSFELDITYRWYTPALWVMLIFVIMWGGFLVSWYGIGLSTGNMPSVFFLVPLIHVAVGIGLTYYTACLFFNTTYITANERLLQVRHAPIPWPWGETELPVSDLAQLFVREKIGNKGKRSYQLLAKTKGDNEVKLMSGMNAPAEVLQKLEKAIEDYLNIADQRVENEYADYKKLDREQAEKVPTLPTGIDKSRRRGIESAEVGHFISYEQRTFRLSYATVYSWNNGNIDRMLQLTEPEGQQDLVYVEQDKGLFHTFLEIEFNQAQQTLLGFKDDPVLRDLKYEEFQFELDNHQLGQTYWPGRTNGIDIEQWIYRTNNRNEQLRIVKYQGIQSVYFGQREIPAAFGEALTP